MFLGSSHVKSTESTELLNVFVVYMENAEHPVDI